MTARPRSPPVSRSSANLWAVDSNDVRVFDAREVGELLGIHPKNVLLMAQRGEIGSVRFGRRTVRFTPGHVRECIQRMTRPAG